MAEKISTHNIASSSDFCVTDSMDFKATGDERPTSAIVENTDVSLHPESIETAEHLTKGQTTSVVAALLFSFALVGLDQNVIATAVPAISHDFLTITDIAWYSSIYCGTLVSGFAPTSTVFILGRALTGLSAAGVISGAFSLITHNVPLQKRPIYAGVGGGTEAIAAACAPLLGGLLTDRLSWRWCFYLQLPFVLLAFGTVCSCPKVSKTDSRPLLEKLFSLDIMGATTFISAATSLLLATQFGAGIYAWSNWRIMLLFVLSALLLLAFLGIQHRRQERAILPPRITMSRNVLFGLIFSATNNGGLAIIEYYMPLYFQNSRGMTASMSGVALLPIVIGLIVSVILSGYLTSIIGYYSPFMLTTSIMTPLANGFLTTLNRTTQMWKLAVFQGLLGIGAGIGFQGPQVAVQTVLSRDDTPVGLGVIQFGQNIGPAIFIAVSQSVFLTQLKIEVRRLGLTKEVAGMILGGTSPSSLPVDQEQRRKVSVVYAEILSRTFYLPTALSCLSMVGTVGIERRSVNSRQGVRTP